MSKKTYRIFTINPGSTSTKIALFQDETMLFSSNIEHESSMLAEFKRINDQLTYREEVILKEVAAGGISLAGVDAFSARGGSLVSMEGGTYHINDIMLKDAREGRIAHHPAMLGSQLAYHFAQKFGGQIFVVNPPDVDEMEEIARVTGLAETCRESRVHALNQKEVAIRYAKSKGKRYEDVNVIVAHIGGGVSIAAHCKGRMIDVDDALGGGGAMAPTRSGLIPSRQLIKLCFSGRYTEKQLLERFTKNGGLVDHLGTSDVREVQRRIAAGDRYAKLVLDAMIYQIGKSIGSYGAVLQGKVDAIILTAGIAHDTYVTGKLTDMVGWIAPVEVFAGEFEMEALAHGALRVLRGEEEAKEYSGIPIWNGFQRK